MKYLLIINFLIISFLLSSCDDSKKNTNKNDISQYEKLSSKDLKKLVLDYDEYQEGQLDLEIYNPTTYDIKLILCEVKFHDNDKFISKRKYMFLLDTIYHVSTGKPFEDSRYRAKNSHYINKVKIRIISAYGKKLNY